VRLQRKKKRILFPYVVDSIGKVRERKGNDTLVFRRGRKGEKPSDGYEKSRACSRKKKRRREKNFYNYLLPKKRRVVYSSRAERKNNNLLGIKREIGQKTNSLFSPLEEGEGERGALIVEDRVVKRRDRSASICAPRV